MSAGGRPTEGREDPGESPLRNLDILEQTGRIARIGGWEHDLVTGEARWTRPLYDIIKIDLADKPPGVHEHLDFYPPRDRAALQEAYRRAVEQGVPFDLELQVHTTDGELIWCRARGEPVFEDGACVKMRGTFQDISDRKEVQERSERLEEELRLIADNTSDVIWRLDESGLIVFVTRSAKMVWGYEPEELVGRHFREVVAEADLARAQEAFLAALAGQAAMQIDLGGLRRDGSVVDLHISVGPSWKDGQVIGVQGIARDVTETRQAERRVQDLARFPEENPYPVLRIAADGTVRYANRVAKDLLADCQSGVGSPAPPAWEESAQAAIAGGEVNRLVIRHDGRAYALHFAGVDGAGYANVYGVDITERKEAEQALRNGERRLAESEKYYRGLMYSIHEDILVIDKDYRIADVNNSFVRTVGLAREQVLGRRCHEVSHGLNEPCDRRGENCALREVFETGEPRNCLHEHIRADGSRVKVDILLSPLHNAEGEVTHVVEAARDVTDIFEAQVALALSEERFRLAMDAVTDGLWDWTCVTGDMYYSPGWGAILGLASVRPTFEEWAQRIHPDDKEAVLASLREHLDGKTEAWSAEHRLRAGDPRGYVWVLGRGRVVIRDESGKPLRMVGTMSDISLRRKQQAELESRMRFQQELLDTIPVPVFYKDAEGRYLGVNRSFEDFFGRSREELVGKTVFDISAPDLAKIYDRMDRKLIDAGDFQVYENRVEDFRGETHEVLFHKAPFTDAEGRVAGIIGAILDMTELKRKEAQFLQAQKMEAVGLLAGGVAHDFRNQLQVIIGFASMLLRRNLVSEEGREKVDHILSAAGRSTELTGQLLAFSRQESLRPVPMDPREAIQELKKSLLQMLGEDIHLLTQVGPDPLCVELDPVQFHQALVNLCINARDAMPKGGELLIAVESVELDEDAAGRLEHLSPGPHVVVSVADTGVGMDGQTQSRAFDPFFTTKEVGKGTGLGLAMVHGFVRQSEGAVTCRSAPDMGTTVAMYFPAVEARVAGKKAVAGHERLQGGTGRVLIVDDERAIRRLMAEELTEAGFEVLEAAGPVEAMNVLSDPGRRLDILVTDVVMPGMSGLDLARKALQTRPGLMVLYMSGYADDDLDRRDLAGLRADVLRKPFSPRALLARLSEMLAGTDRD